MTDRKKLKKVLGLCVTKLNFYLQTKAFEKRYSNVDCSLFQKDLNEDVVNKYKDRWKGFGVKVEINTFLLCYNLSNNINYDIVPENIFSGIIEPSLNNYKQLSFISIKNIYEKWFGNASLFPKSYLHKIDNVYYDKSFNVVEDIHYYLDNSKLIYPIICKPSIGTAGGEGVKILNSLEEIKESLNTYENLVYQEKILQNSFIDEINPGMSSIRTCLYRAKNGKFKVLNNSIRFGVDGGLDNETAGGIVCNINEAGRLNDYALSKYCAKYIEHPNSKLLFSEVSIPFYENLSEVAESIANEIPLANLVSLDMCLDINDKWRCIEINLGRQTIRFAQYAGVGFFGDYTDEVIRKVLNKG